MVGFYTGLNFYEVTWKWAGGGVECGVYVRVGASAVVSALEQPVIC